MNLLSLLSMLIVGSGFFFLAVAAAGAVRLPDFYTRSHALGVMDTLGTFLMLLGISLHLGLRPETVKLVLIALFIYVANPTMTHVLIRAALKSGLKPWKKEDLGE